MTELIPPPPQSLRDLIKPDQPLPDLSRDEILLLLIEECGEVIQAATKCLRFGFDREWPGYGNNSVVLATEIGDVLGCIDALPLKSATHFGAVVNARISKIERARKAKASIGNPDKPAAFPIVGGEGGGS